MDDESPPPAELAWPPVLLPPPGRPRERYVEKMARQCVLPVEVAAACRAAGVGLAAGLPMALLPRKMLQH